MATISASTRIDQAFAKFPPHIQEIVNKLRQLIHKTEPSIRETWKWGAAY